VIRFEYGMTTLFRALASVALLLLAVSAFAQQPPAGTSQELHTQLSDSLERLGDHHIRRIGHVELNYPNGSSLYADEAEIFEDKDLAVATGNVVLAQGNNRISAERAELNTKTGLGTFYNASGIADVQPPRQPARPGTIAPPPPSGQDTIVYFFGDKVEKIGPKKYRITKGGFTTCVQPTPRWDLHADTVVLNMDHYTLLKGAVFTVKGVPMLYVPILYYPTKREGRATGLLIPTYGASSLRGQSISNAFFWAINRSQDATVLHDWFSKTGQGVGGEYRYNFGGGSDGNVRTYLLDQHDTTLVGSDGRETPYPGSRSYEIRGSANQLLPGNLRARGRVDYFSSIATSQTFNTNIYDASRNSRSFGGNVVGAWSTYSLNGTFDRSEYFYDTTNSGVTGSWPRIAVSRNERPLFGSPVYFTIGTEFAHLLSESKSATASVDRSQSRFDVSPRIRYPFKKWQWLTVNSTFSWRDTFYTRSYDPVATTTVIDDSVNRRFYTYQAQIVGPVFNRVWDTPKNGYAERFKHSVEPVLTVQRTSLIDNSKRIVVIDGTDSIVGGNTTYTYGLNSRFYAKRRLAPGAPAQAREIIDVALMQSHYSKDAASNYDSQYQTSFGGSTPSNYSPIALSVRAMPSTTLTATMRAEFDSRYLALRTISASGTYTADTRLQTTVSWSKRAFIKELAGFNNPASLDQYLNISTTARAKDNRVGGSYAVYYDILHSAALQQRMSAFYNAQCCGLAVEYQTFSFGGVSASSAIAADHRFFLSFTLAGLGNFSPFNGALSGAPR